MCIIGEVTDELEPLMRLPVMDLRPEELEFEDAYGFPKEVVDLGTTRLDGFGAVVGARGEALVKVRVKYSSSSMAHDDIIIVACRGT